MSDNHKKSPKFLGHPIFPISIQGAYVESDSAWIPRHICIMSLL